MVYGLLFFWCFLLENKYSAWKCLMENRKWNRFHLFDKVLIWYCHQKLWSMSILMLNAKGPFHYRSKTVLNHKSLYSDVICFIFDKETQIDNDPYQYLILGFGKIMFSCGLYRISRCRAINEILGCNLICVYILIFRTAVTSNRVPPVILHDMFKLSRLWQ